MMKSSWRIAPIFVIALAGASCGTYDSAYHSSRVVRSPYYSSYYYHPFYDPFFHRPYYYYPPSHRGVIIDRMPYRHYYPRAPIARPHSQLQPRARHYYPRR
jgi:hypothetical protein